MVNQEQRLRALRLRLDGLSFAQIGKMLGVSRQRVQQMTAPTARIRAVVVERAGGKCQGCDLPVGSSGHVHHRLSRGATPDNYNDVDNLQLLCIGCHRAEHPNPHKDESHAMLAFRQSFREAILERCAGQTNEQVARLFGVSAPFISMVRSGVKGSPNLSRRMTARALKLWPSLTDAYLRELLAEGGEPTDAAAHDDARATVA